ncbi:hypothetical protein GCK72_023977 [Caenorhabditis remanei]|uniref:Uncharacterized protein n=1 Tax=Caenorhabditis remanei TaxID=31234 RepID=A0A6A5FYC2_CAERE|nr:hypothetical protein GCK72_023977 [Caenorhabditis remanei]KAF1747512.1 hypothetical protein GCK72_023977 [Caenorhabditis remanei]
MSYQLTFEPDYQKTVLYHRQLKAEHPEAASELVTSCDRQFILTGDKVTLPPASHPNSNKALVNFFNTVLMQKFVKEPVFVYAAELFDELYENKFAMETVTKNDYTKLFYKLFKVNDLVLLQKKIILFPINYGYTWHLVAINQPLKSTVEGENCDVYLVSAHRVVPQFSLAKVITKYLEMAFSVMNETVIKENFKFHEMVLEDCANQPQVLCCVYTELAFKIYECKKEMSLYFSGIKPDVQQMKFNHYIFARYMQTMLNCFAVEHNEFGQIPHFNVITLEDEDLVWVEKTDLDRILNPNRQLRTVRPLRQFAPKREPISEWMANREAARKAEEPTSTSDL